MLLLACVPPVHGLVVDASVGFGGVYVPNKWTPVTLTVENMPDAGKARQAIEGFDGQLRVLPHASLTEQTIFTRPLALPVNDRKRMTLYVRILEETDGETRIELANARGKVVQEHVAKRFALKPGQVLVGCVHSAEGQLAMPKIDGVPETLVRPIDPEELPDRWYGYDSLALLVIPRVTEQVNSREAAGAIEKWVSQGGRLLCIGGRYADSWKGSAYERMLPGLHEGLDLYRLGDDGTLTSAPAQAQGEGLVQIARVKPADGCRVLVEHGGVPILLSRRYGSGEVLYLASDWSTRGPIGANVSRLVTTYLALAPSFDAVRKRFDQLSLFNNPEVLDIGLAGLLPDPVLILLILGSYLLLVGPLNFFILWRIKRLELAWLTVPAIVIVYSTAIYALSSHIKGKDSFHRDYTLLTGTTGSSTVRADTISMLFVPRPGNMPIAPGNADAAVSPARDQWEYGLRNAGVVKQMVMEQSAKGLRFVKKPVGQWEADYTQMDHVVDLGGEVDSQLGFDGTRIRGSVSNRTKYPLRNLLLAVNGILHYVDVPDGSPAGVLHPGQTVAVDIEVTPDQLTNLADAGKSRAHRPAMPLTGDGLTKLVMQQFAAYGRNNNADYIEGGTLNLQFAPPVFILCQPQVPAPPLETGAEFSRRSSHAILALAAPVAGDAASIRYSCRTGGPLVPDGVQRGYSHYRHYTPVSLPLADEPALFGFAIPWHRADASTLEMEFTVEHSGYGRPPGGEKDEGPSVVADVLDMDTWQWRQLNPEKRSAGGDAKPANDGSMHVVADLSEPGRCIHPFCGGALVRLRRQVPASLLNKTRPSVMVKMAVSLRLELLNIEGIVK